jgi:N6-L-threonylcarbamoyladenine synthase
MCAKGIAVATGLPLVGVNHLAGHALTPRLTNSLPYPYLMLLVSGGHCQFLIVAGQKPSRVLAERLTTRPARLLTRPQSCWVSLSRAGPSVEREAASADAARFPFPRPILDREGCDMSFSGLKTALLRARDTVVAQKGGLTVQDRADLCSGFQAAIADVLTEKSRRALRLYLAECPSERSFAVAGGVAANSVIRSRLMAMADELGVRFVAPPLALCTDNAAMIAWAGIEQFQAGRIDGLDFSARPRWPLDQTAPAMLGSGKKGAKA